MSPCKAYAQMLCLRVFGLGRQGAPHPAYHMLIAASSQLRTRDRCGKGSTYQGQAQLFQFLTVSFFLAAVLHLQSGSNKSTPPPVEQGKKLMKILKPSVW